MYMMSMTHYDCDVSISRHTIIYMQQKFYVNHAHLQVLSAKTDKQQINLMLLRASRDNIVHDEQNSIPVNPLPSSPVLMINSREDPTNQLTRCTFLFANEVTYFAVAMTVYCQHEQVLLVD